MRKSVRITKGVKLNLSKSGVGMTVGGKGAHYTVHSSGRRTSSVGLPGTGLSYVSSQGGGGGRSHAVRQTQPLAPPTHQFSKPGLFAPKADKELYKIVKDGLDIAALDEAATLYPSHHSLALALAGIKRMEAKQEEDTAIRQLQEALESGYDPSTDNFAQHYLSFIAINVGLPNYSVARLPLSKALLAIIVSGSLLKQDRQQEALKLIPHLRGSIAGQILLAELYYSCGLPEKVTELTNHVHNSDDASMLLLAFRGKALAKQGHLDAALETFKEALRYPSRPIELKMFTWFNRAKAYIDAGKMSLARKDLEKIMAEDSTYDGLSDLLKVANTSATKKM